MFHSVIVASRGRGEVLRETVRSLQAQSVAADEIIVSVTGRDDLPAGGFAASVQTLCAPRGVTRQINTAVAGTDPHCDIVSIFDDDVELSPDYFANVRRFFKEHPDVVFFDGTPAAFGVNNHRDARKMLQARPAKSPAFLEGRPIWGCNMNLRRWILDREKFDEALALYGWLHEYDFGSRVARLGRFGRYEGCRFVHLEVPQGRITGVKHGFSQIMNAVYFYKKHSVVKSLADLIFGHILKVPAINLYWLLRGDRRIDRWGRLRGNLLAIARAIAGSSDPRQVENIS